MFSQSFVSEINFTDGTANRGLQSKVYLSWEQPAPVIGLLGLKVTEQSLARHILEQLHNLCLFIHQQDL